VSIGAWLNPFKPIPEPDPNQRVRAMERAYDAYRRGAPAQLKVKAGQADDNVRVNKVRVVVDKGVSFLFGKPIQFVLTTEEDEADAGESPGAKQPTDPRQVYLDKCWLYNKQTTLLHKLAMNGAICGQAFLKIIPADPGQAFPTLKVLDPATFDVITDPSDVDEVQRYIQTWTASTIDVDASGREVEREMRYRQTTKRVNEDGWVIVDEVSRMDAATWQTVGTTAWPHPYPPISACQNLPSPNEWWGISDIEDDVLGLNAQAGFTISNTQRIIRYHASPQSVATGVGPKGEISRDVDGVVVLPNPDAKLWNLEMQSDLKAACQQYDDLCEAIHEVARVPAISTGTLTNLGQLSGVALQVLYQPLLEKTSTKREFYGEMLCELSRRLLDLAGLGDDAEIDINWPEMLPVDPLQQRQALLLEDQMAVVSKQTIAESLDRDWDTEQERMANEKAATVADAQAAMAASGAMPAQPGAAAVPVPGQAQSGAQDMLPKVPTLNARTVAGMKPEG